MPGHCHRNTYTGAEQQPKLWAWLGTHMLNMCLKDGWAESAGRAFSVLGPVSSSARGGYPAHTGSLLLLYSTGCSLGGIIKEVV